jgi:hypothetical protein
MKEKVTSNLTRLIKEAAIDCATYSKRGTKEQLECVQYGEPRVSEISFTPDIKKQPSDTFESKNKDTIQWRGRTYNFRGKQFIYREIDQNTGNLYDMESYYQALENPNISPLLVAVEEKRNGKFIIKSVNA